MLISCLKKNISISSTNLNTPSLKKNNIVPILVCNILYHVFLNEEKWPIEFVQVNYSYLRMN